MNLVWIIFIFIPTTVVLKNFLMEAGAREANLGRESPSVAPAARLCLGLTVPLGQAQISA